MNFPLDLRFKVIAISRQMAVRDSLGNLICYVKQKAFKLREAITVFADEAQTMPLYRISADRIIDFSPNYRIEDTSGQLLGVVTRRGMRSLWRASYEVSRGAGGKAFIIQETNPWVKVADKLLGDIPIVGIASVYLFHPRYRVARADSGGAVMEAEKQPAIFEGRVRIDSLGAMSPEDERLALMSLLLMLLLEKTRG